MTFYATRLLLAVGLGCGVFAQANTTTAYTAPTDKLLVLAKEDSAARTGDAEALQQLIAARRKAGWLVKISKMWFVKPPQLTATIYLWPDSQTARLRRGEWVQAFSPDPPTKPWELIPPGSKEHTYAQVSLPDGPFEGKPGLPGILDEPFAVTGKISDADLVAVVDYIRTSPNSMQVRRLPDGPDGEIREEISGGGPADGTKPIARLQCTDPATVIITTTRRPGAGQTITVQKADGHWKLQGVSEWVA